MSRKRTKKAVSPEVLARREAKAAAKQELISQIVELYNSTKIGGNASEVARQLGIKRSRVARIIKQHVGKAARRKVAAGSIRSNVHRALKLPSPGHVKRYILTSAQNNTFIHSRVWENLKALAKHYSAEIMVGSFSYNQNQFGPLAVKRGRKNEYQHELWYDHNIEPHIVDDPVQLGDGLVWCGEMNILPTDNDPLANLETYSGSKSCIVPHAKMEMNCVATMQSHGTKFMYSTGTVTKRNYIQKKAGLKAEHRHAYGGLLVEVDSNGNWWVRQVEADENSGKLQDLDIVVDNGRVSKSGEIEAITWGDIHATIIDKGVHKMSLEILDEFKPRFQFVHDLLEGVSVNHHNAKNPHEQFSAFLRGYDVVTKELVDTAAVLESYKRPGTETVVIDSNHDNWLMRWLREHDYRKDPRNAELFLDLQREVYKNLREENEKFNLTEYTMEKFGIEKVTFKLGDDSFLICNRKIECGMHGHMGSDGARGSVKNLARLGRKANTAHTHSASIINGLYTAGTSTKLRMGYNHGPSSWTHSHIFTYPTGKRTIVTMYNNKWRA